MGAELKHGELEKQIKMLRDEFDILSRVHAELKEQFEREKEAMVAEKNSLLVSSLFHFEKCVRCLSGMLWR